MKRTTNILTKTKRGINKQQNLPPVYQTSKDLFLAVLIVSMLGNAAILIGWVALKVTDRYDAQVVSLLF